MPRFVQIQNRPGKIVLAYPSSRQADRKGRIAGVVVSGDAQIGLWKIVSLKHTRRVKRPKGVSRA